MGPDALVVAPALPAAHGLVAPAVAAAPLVAALGSQAGLAESGQGWPAWLGSRLLPAVPGSQVETGEPWEGWPAWVSPALPPELPDSRAAWAEPQGDWQDSIWPASSPDSRAVLVWFLLWDDSGPLDLVGPPREALPVPCPVCRQGDLSDYRAPVRMLAGCQEWEDGKRAADSSSCLDSRAWHSTRLAADDTRHLVGDTVSPILPNTRCCSTRGVNPNSIPSRPIPTAGCW